MNTIKKQSHLVTVGILPTLKFEMIKSLVMAVVYSYGYGLLYIFKARKGNRCGIL